jgi:hypothetical protein
VRCVTRKPKEVPMAPEEGGGGRIRRRSVATVAENRRPRRQHRAPGLDSLHEVEEEDMAHRLVAAEALGVAGVGWAPVRCSQRRGKTRGNERGGDRWEEEEGR